MKPVLNDSLLDVPETKMIIATICDKRATSDVLKFLKSQNLDILPHLKMFRSVNGCLDVALCRPEQLDVLKECLNVSVVKDVVTDFREIPVAARVPQLKTQFDKANSLWPVAFHRNKRLSALIEGTFFSKDFLHFLDEVFENKVVKICRREDILQSQLKCCPNLLTVIIDDKKMEVLNVSSNSGVDGAEPYHPLGHSVMVCVEAVAQIQRQSDVDSQGMVSAASEVGQSVSPSASAVKPKQNPAERSFEDRGGYLCSGLVALLTHEPCSMCCMTLLHSRISSVIYSLPFEKGGYMGSVKLIHDNANFNHKFNVFKDFRGRELQDILERVVREGGS